MKKIYILLMHTNTMPARLIRAVTRYKYSHVAISFDDKCDITYSFGRKELHSIFNSGFVKEYKNGDFFNTFNNTECKIYEIDISDEQYNNALSLIHYMELHQSLYKYDFIGIVLRFFNIPLTFRYRYVCSYWVAWFLQESKIYKFNKKVCFIEPKDFEHLNGCKEIFCGNYNSYRNNCFPVPHTLSV